MIRQESQAAAATAAAPVVRVDGLIEQAHVHLVRGDAVPGEKFGQPVAAGADPVVFRHAFGIGFIIWKNIAVDAVTAHVFIPAAGFQFERLALVFYLPVAEAQVVASGGPVGGKWVWHELAEMIDGVIIIQAGSLPKTGPLR